MPIAKLELRAIIRVICPKYLWHFILPKVCPHYLCNSLGNTSCGGWCIAWLALMQLRLKEWYSFEKRVYETRECLLGEGASASHIWTTATARVTGMAAERLSLGSNQEIDEPTAGTVPVPVSRSEPAGGHGGALVAPETRRMERQRYSDRPQQLQQHE